MRKLILLAVAVAVAGCGATKAKQELGNPAVQKDTREAQAIVDGCVSKGNFLTHGGRQAIIHCIAPPGHEAAFERCATQDVSKGFLTSGQRKRLYAGLTVCVEKNR